MINQKKGYKQPPENTRRPKKPTPPPPEKRGLTVDEIISKYPMSVRILIVQLIEQIKRLEKPPELADLAGIAEGWAEAKAEKIFDLIKDAQDEDFSDTVTGLHYLGLSLDIVTSIIDDLRPERKK